MKFDFDWGCIKQIQNGLQSLLMKYVELFREELETLRSCGETSGI